MSNEIMNSLNNAIAYSWVLGWYAGRDGSPTDSGKILATETIKTKHPDIVRACNNFPALLAELQTALKDMESDPVQCVGDWERGLFCGLEDRGINDVYEACRHGYEAALEKVNEWVLCSFEAAIAAADVK